MEPNTELKQDAASEPHPRDELAARAIFSGSHGAAVVVICQKKKKGNVGSRLTSR